MTRLAAGALALAVLVAAGAAVLLSRGRATPVAATAVPVGTVSVTRTDIVSRQRVNGTLDYGGTFTVSAPAGVTPEQLQQAAAAVAADQAALAAAVQAAADTASANQLSVNQAQAAVAAAGNPGALAQAQQQLATAQQHGQQAQHQANAQASAARLKLGGDQAALQIAQSGARLDGSFTALPAAGAAIQQGQALYAVDGHPVVLLYGSEPAYRQLCPGASGDDVRQLERDLLDLGFATTSTLSVDGDFTGADAAAVQRWQAALGVPQTGTVRLGEVVFAAGPVRVAGVRAALGAAAQPGTPVVDLTTTRHTVTAQLDAGRQQLVHQGDQVSVLMPDGHTTVGGTVADVSRVATQPPSQGQGQSQQQPTIAVTVTLADESAAGSLDRAPVYVSIIAASRRGVLAVPVTALLAQPNGDYALAVHAGGRRHLVTVQPGLFGDSGLVEVSGAGLAQGDVVEVPAR